jgi:hypothetical protein
MYQLELSLSEELLRKMKALKILKGSSGDDMEPFLVSMLDRTVTNELLRILSGDATPVVAPREEMPKPREEVKAKYYSDATEISDGLGDYDADEDFSPAVSKGGLTEEVLAKDMEVDDPEHEAKSEPPVRDAADKRSEDIFSQVYGVPVPEVGEGASDGWSSRRRKQKPKLKARVTPATGVERDIE